MRIPTDLALALLEALEVKPDGLSWRGIASRLTALEIPRQPDLLTGLKELRTRGYLTRDAGTSSVDHWRVTAEGLAALEALREFKRVPGTQGAWVDFGSGSLGIDRSLPESIDSLPRRELMDSFPRRRVQSAA